MAGICAVLALVGACIAFAFGVVRLFPAYRRCADLAATRPIRDAAFVAQARAEVDDYRWLDSQRFAYARDEDGYLDFSLLAPCDEAAFYGYDDSEGEVRRG